MAEAQLNNMPDNLGGGGDDEENRPESNREGCPEEKPMKNTPSKGSSKPSSKEGAQTTTEEFSSASETVATSTALAHATVGSLASSASHPMEVDRQRDILQHQMIVLTVATTATLAIFVMTVIPFTILVVFGMFATSAGLLSYATFQRLVLEYQEIVAGDGFAQFLPPSVMQNLTETTLHQFLRDDTFLREWGFLALYFAPGLTEDQLNDYILRLAPDRQVFLNRGMGHVLGDRFMRVMVGERRWRQEAITTRVPTIVANVPTNEEIVVRSRCLDLDSDAESNASAPIASLTVPRESSTGGGRIPLVSIEERRRELAHEGDVIMAALWDGFYNYVNLATVTATQVARDQMIAPLAGIATTVGLVSSVGVVVLSVGTGIWRYSRPSSPAQQPTRAFFGFLLSTTMLGGLSTGVMLYARSAMQRSAKPPPSKPTQK